MVNFGVGFCNFMGDFLYLRFDNWDVGLFYLFYFYLEGVDLFLQGFKFQGVFFYRGFGGEIELSASVYGGRSDLRIREI